MRKISRQSAKKLLALVKFAKMSSEEYLEETSLEFVEEFYTPIDEKHILYNLEIDLNGVVNQFLEKQLQKYGFELEVVGTLEDVLFDCPCCKSYSLDDRLHDICPVCKWHDDGTRNPDKVSGANRMTLKEGQTNFRKYGVTKLKYLEYNDYNAIPLYSKYPVKEED